MAPTAILLALMPQAPDLWIWLTIPAIGAAIGLSTNWLAVKMIFRPIRARRILGIRLQGLVPRRQQELAKAIGNVVGNHLVEHRDIVRGLENINFEDILEVVLDRGLAPKIKELRSLPLIGGFLTEDRVGEIRKAIVEGVMAHKGDVLSHVERGLAAGLDVPRLVEEKVGAFAVERLEQLILEVANRELRAIVILGGVLGTLIGLAQVGFLWWYG